MQEEVARRCAKNPRYSLRAFARHLGMDHSTLSQLVRGRRPFTPRTIERLGARLRLAPEAVVKFLEAEREPSEPWTAREARTLTADAASLLAEWHHYAILELTRLPSFEPDVRWIGRVLGLTPDEVNVALNRLLRLGLLEMSDAGRWTDAAGDAVASLDDFSSRTVSGLAERVRGLRSAGALPAHQSATTLAVASARCHDVLSKLERFRHELIDHLEGGSAERDQVYRLELAFYPLADLEQKEH